MEREQGTRAADTSAESEQGAAEYGGFLGALHDLGSALQRAISGESGAEGASEDEAADAPPEEAPRHKVYIYLRNGRRISLRVHRLDVSVEGGKVTALEIGGEGDKRLMYVALDEIIAIEAVKAEGVSWHDEDCGGAGNPAEDAGAGDGY